MARPDQRLFDLHVRRIRFHDPCHVVTADDQGIGYHDGRRGSARHRDAARGRTEQYHHGLVRRQLRPPERADRRHHGLRPVYSRDRPRAWIRLDPCAALHCRYRPRRRLRGHRGTGQRDLAREPEQSRRGFRVLIMVARVRLGGAARRLRVAALWLARHVLLRRRRSLGGALHLFVRAGIAGLEAGKKGPRDRQGRKSADHRDIHGSLPALHLVRHAVIELRADRLLGSQHLGADLPGGGARHGRYPTCRCSWCC